jgi:hypothetical protein
MMQTIEYGVAETELNQHESYRGHHWLRHLIRLSCDSP